MRDTPKESQRPKIEELIDGEITRIIAIHMMNIQVMHGPFIHLSTAEEVQRIFEAQVARAAERIVSEVLIPELQPNTHPQKGKMSLKPDVLQYVMLNFEKLQATFLKVFREVLKKNLPEAICNQLSIVNVSVFDREMMVALAGGRPEDPSERNAGEGVDAILDRFAARARSAGCSKE